MFSILNRALSRVITSFRNKFCLKKRSRLIKALDNRFYIKFMQLEIGLLLKKNCMLKSVRSALSDMLTTSATHGTFSRLSTKRGLILIGLELNTNARESF